MKNIILSICLSGALGASTAWADNPKPDLDRTQQRGSLARPDSREMKTLHKAAEVYRTVIHNSRGEIPAAVVRDAKCIAIVPDAISAAAGIGGMHGDGVGFCRNINGDWTGPAFLSLNAASIGAQAGVKSADMVLFINRDDAEKAMLEGGLKFGGEVSAVAGTYDKTFALPRNGIAVYSDTEGVFAGASLSEGSISRNDTRGREFYGESYDKTKLFTTTNPLREDNTVKDLLAMLPK